MSVVHQRRARTGRTLRAVLVAFATLVALTLPSAPATAAGPDAVHVARLSSAQEVPTNDSRAVGVTVLLVSGDRESVNYRFVVAGLSDVTMAHIHLAPAGVNGPVVAWLYPDAPPPVLLPGRTNGVLATGTITEDDLVGPLAGADLDDLLDAVAAGSAYVNVHTLAFPGGEIRGQLR